MDNSLNIKKSTLTLLIGVISFVVFIESSIPYICAEHKTVAGSKFLGQIAYNPDQDMYFSFIREARNGEFIFNNRLTYTYNKPAFVNLEWWLVGTIQRITGLGENGIYYVWRYMGILLLTIGATLLAKIILPTIKQVWMCVMILLFTGGFGFVFALLNSLHLIGFETTHSGILDMRFGFLPFQQAMTNPHFSFPHGLILIAYAFFLLGEQEGKNKYYVLSGLLFAIIGLVRPYDIIPPFAIFPVYILITNGGSKLDIKLLVRKLLPLIMIGPVLLYDLWLFKFNAAFKDWSTQGLNAGSLPSVMWHYLTYGIAGVLAIVRLMQIKINPLSRNDKFLLVWFLVTFGVIHLGKYFPVIGWSPQIGVYLAVPLGLLGCSIQYDLQKKKAVYYGTMTVTALCVVVSNLSIVLYYTKNFSDPAKTPIFYADKNEVAAWEWLNKNIKQGDVVLAMPSTSLRLAKYTDANVAAAHYSVSPKYNETAGMVHSVYSNATLGDQQKTALVQLNARYVFIGPDEMAINKIKVDSNSYLTQVYINPVVSIYKVN